MEMSDLGPALFFAFTAMVALGVIGHSLWHMLRQARQLHAAARDCPAVRVATIRWFEPAARPAPLRLVAVTPAPRLPVAACGLRAAA